MEAFPPIRLGRRRIPVAVFGMVLRDALERQPHPRRGLLQEERAVAKRGDQCPRPRRPAALGEIVAVAVDELLEPAAHSPAQNATERRRGEEMLREQPRAIRLDELPQRRERPRIANALENREPQLAGVGHPGVEEARNEEREPVEDPLGDDRAGGKRAVGPGGAGTDDNPLGQRRRRRLEHPIKLTYARRPLGPPALERLGEMDDRGGFGHEAEPRQARGEPFEEPLAGPGADDAVGATAARQRHIEHRLADELPPDNLEPVAGRGGVAREERGEEPPDRPLRRAGRRGWRRCWPDRAGRDAGMEPGREHPQGFRRLDGGIDKMLGGGIPLPAEPVVFRRRHPRRRRRIGSRDRSRGPDKRPPQAPQMMPPGLRRIELGRRCDATVGDIGGDDRRHGLPQEPEQPAEKLCRMFDLADPAHRGATGPFDVEHPAVDAVVGRVAPRKSLVGSSHTLFRSGCLVVAVVVIDSVIVAPGATARLGALGEAFDAIGDGGGVGLDELEKPADTVAPHGGAVGHGQRQPLRRRRQPHRPEPFHLDPFQERGPVDKQAHRTIEIPFPEERLGGMGVAARRGELGHLGAPKAGRGR